MITKLIFSITLGVLLLNSPEARATESPLPPVTATDAQIIKSYIDTWSKSPSPLEGHDAKTGHTCGFNSFAGFDFDSFAFVDSATVLNLCTLNEIDGRAVPPICTKHTDYNGTADQQDPNWSLDRAKNEITFQTLTSNTKVVISFNPQTRQITKTTWNVTTINGVSTLVCLARP